VKRKKGQKKEDNLTNVLNNHAKVRKLVGDKYESRQRYFEDVYDMHKSYLIIYNYINLACLEFVILAYNL
jgi:hypothetical protein